MLPVTTNGQAAFLFLLASTLAPLVRLSYTLVMSITGFLMVYYGLQSATEVMYEKGLTNHHVAEHHVESKNKGKH